MMRFLLFFFITAYAVASSYDEGEILYFQKGCHSCHGPTGQGMHNFPKLANVKAQDLRRKLTAYRQDHIKTPQASIMTAYAKAMSDVEMEHIIFYLANYMPPHLDKRYDDSFKTWGDGGS